MDAMLPSGNSSFPLPARPFVVVGNPLCPRVTRFQDALNGLGLPPALEIAWTDVLAGRITLPNVVTQGAIVRLEAPGTAFETERVLLAWGADEPEECGEYDRITRQDAASLAFDKGRIGCPRQWFLGFRAALRLVSHQLDACPPHARMNHPPDVETMFDKPHCQELLRASGVPVPRSLGVLAGYDDLLMKMQQMSCRQAFIKLAHGSSASGVVAYRTNGTRHQAITTVEMVRADGQLRLYNTRQVQTYREQSVIAELIEALCRHRAYAEEWIPKAGMDGHAFDLRVVVIGGQTQQIVARLSRTPMTNLHLRNPRRTWEFARTRIGEEAAQSALQTCVRALSCFPRSLYAGVDVLFAPGFRRHAVLELNAFGDLLPGTLHEGHDTYQSEICAALQTF